MRCVAAKSSAGPGSSRMKATAAAIIFARPWRRSRAFRPVDRMPGLSERAGHRLYRPGQPDTELCSLRWSRRRKRWLHRMRCRVTTRHRCPGVSLMSVATAANQQPATAADADPETLGFMQGFPPPPDKLITFQNGSFRSFPELRWAWSNIRQLVPTVNVWRGAGPASVLPRAEQDIGASASVTMDGRPMTFSKMLEETYT